MTVEVKPQNLKPTKQLGQENQYQIGLDTWLHDFHIQCYFDSMNEELSQSRTDILLVGPSLSQIIKNGSNYDALVNLTGLSFDLVTYAIFCVSNYDDKNSDLKSVQVKGSHWSLLLFNRKKQKFFHYDSIKGLNIAHAKKLANNLNKEFSFVEIDTLQQKNSFECGIHVMVNARYIVNEFMNESRYPANKVKHRKQKSQDINHSKNKEDESSKNNNSKCIINNKIDLNNRFSILSNYTDVCETSLNDTNDIFGTSCNIVTPSVSKRSSRHSLKENQNHCYYTRSKNKIPFTPTIKNEPSFNYDKTVTLLARHNHVLHDVDSSSTIFNKKINKTTQLDTKNSVKTDDLLKNYKPKIEPNTCNESMQKACKNRIKLFTDSHGRFFNQLMRNSELSNDFNITSAIKPNGTINNVLHSFENETKELNTNDFTIIMAGTNDIHPNMNERDVYNEIEDKIKSVKNTNILLSAIPYRYDDPILNKLIRKINKNLRKITEKYIHCSFVQLLTLKRYHFTYHGIHMNILGKRELLGILTDLITNDKVEKNIPTIVTERGYFLATNRYNPGKF